MDSTGGMDWNLLGIGFWCGILVLSLIELLLIFLNHNLFLYNVYIMVVSVPAIMFYLFMRRRSAAP
jgi:hypothetical protein